MTVSVGAAASSVTGAVSIISAIPASGVGAKEGGDSVAVIGASRGISNGSIGETTDASTDEETVSIGGGGSEDGGGKDVGVGVSDDGAELCSGESERSVNVFASFMASAIQSKDTSVGAALFKRIENPFVLLFATR